MAESAHQTPTSAAKDTHAKAPATPDVSGPEAAPLSIAGRGLSVDQLTPGQVLHLQRTLGNQAVQRLTQQAASPQKSAPAAPRPDIHITPADRASIQRRLGFEFEEARWRAWKVENGRVRSAGRKEELHSGTNFKLEGDDTPGDKLANIEFVTEPFDATDDGLEDYLATMTEVLDIVENITPLAGRPGPGTDDEVKTAKRNPRYDPTGYVNQDEHGFNKAGVALSKGTRNGLGSFKMQATSGISLENIPAVMEMFGITPKENRLKTLRQGGSDQNAIQNSMGIGAPEYNQLSDNLARKAPARSIQASQKLMGGGPTVARHAVGLLGAEPMYSVPQKTSITNHPEKLIGFLSLIAMNIKGLGVQVNGPAKYRLPFLGRNNFVTLLADLLPIQQAALRAHAGTPFVDAVIAANNAVSIVPNDGGKTRDTPLVPGVPTLSDLTIGVWLTGILEGRDYLDPATISLLMNGQRKWNGMKAKYSSKDRDKSKDALESFATIPDMDTSEGPNAMAIVENRGIIDGFATDYPMDKAIAVGYNYLKYFVDLAAGNTGGAYDYPQHTVSRQQPEDDSTTDETTTEESTTDDEVEVL
jgi:hypothetical protein